jgi:hypothetical protein
MQISAYHHIVPYYESIVIGIVHDTDKWYNSNSRVEEGRTNQRDRIWQDGHDVHVVTIHHMFVIM